MKVITLSLILILLSQQSHTMKLERRDPLFRLKNPEPESKLGKMVSNILPKFKSRNPKINYQENKLDCVDCSNYGPEAWIFVKNCCKDKMPIVSPQEDILGPMYSYNMTSNVTYSNNSGSQETETIYNNYYNTTTQETNRFPTDLYPTFEAENGSVTTTEISLLPSQNNSVSNCPSKILNESDITTAMNKNTFSEGIYVGENNMSITNIYDYQYVSPPLNNSVPKYPPKEILNESGITTALIRHTVSEEIYVTGNNMTSAHIYSLNNSMPKFPPIDTLNKSDLTTANNGLTVSEEFYVTEDNMTSMQNSSYNEENSVSCVTCDYYKDEKNNNLTLHRNRGNEAKKGTTPLMKDDLLTSLNHSLPNTEKNRICKHKVKKNKKICRHKVMKNKKTHKQKITGNTEELFDERNKTTTVNIHRPTDFIENIVNSESIQNSTYNEENNDSYDDCQSYKNGESILIKN